MYTYTKDGITVTSMLDTRRQNTSGEYPVKIRVNYKRIRNYYFWIAFALCAILFSFMKPAYWDVLTLSCVLMGMGVTLYAEHLEKKDLLAHIFNQGDAAESLLDQINRRYNEALLVQEIGQKSSDMTKVDELLQYIIESLV